MTKTLWDLFHFYSPLWASCTIAFKDTPLNVIQLNGCLVYNSKKVENNERSFVWS